MKKILVFFIVTGIVLGIFIGIRTVILNDEKNNSINNKEQEEKEYFEAINLPLIETDTLNPLLTDNRHTLDALKLVYEPLICINEQNKLEPALAIEWVEKDDLNWIVKLRADASWHSEKPFLPEDVIFTVNAIKQHAEKSVYGINVSNIIEISKLDESSLNFKLEKRDEYLPYKLTFPIMPKYYWHDDIDNIEKANRPIGTGVYKFHSIDNDTRLIKLIVNDKWWKEETIKLKTIYLYRYNSYGEAIKAFKSGKIDAINTTMNTWDKKFGTIGLNSYRYESTEYTTIIPNTEKAVLAGLSVRRAILYAINRESIELNIYNGNARSEDMPIHEYSWLYDKTMNVSQDIEKSKQLLLNAGWKQANGTWTKNINGKQYSLKLSMLVDKDNDEKVEVAEIIKSNLESVGIKVTINKVNWDTLNSNINSGNFDMALATINIQNDMDVIELLRRDSYTNYARYKNDDINNIIDTINLSNLGLKDAYKELQVKYKLETPYIGLYFKTDTLLTNKAVKGNIHPTWWNTYNKIWTWTK